MLTAATELDMKPEELPTHPINVIGTAIASDPPTVTNSTVQFEGIATDYLSKDKQVEISMTFFHPPKSRLVKQTMSVKRDSNVFFSGSLSLIEDQFYLELHNFNFMRGQANSSSKRANEMPWLNNSGPSSTQASPSKNLKSTITAAQSVHKNTQEQQVLNMRSVKRRSITKFQPSKMAKLSDLATAALSVQDSSNENIEVPEETTSET